MNIRTYSYESGRFFLQPGSKPYIFYILLKPEALQAIGVLKNILDVFASKGIPLLQLKVSSPPMAKITIIVIAELREKESHKDSLLAELSTVKYVEDVRVVPPLAEGIVVDTLSFPLTVMGERSVIMRRTVYEGFIKGGWSRFGTAYAAMLYLMGFEAGRSAYRSQSKISGDPDVLLKMASALFQMLGYGILEFVKVDDKAREAVVRVYDSFECELFKGAGEIRSGFVRGLIAGFLAERWGVSEVVAREVKCIAKGDPYCEIHVSVEKSVKT